MKRAFLLLVVAACSEPNLDDPPVQDTATTSTKKSTSEPAPAPSASGSGSPVVEDAGPPPGPVPTARRWHGTLDTAAPVTFGGTAGYCSYRITMKNLVVDLASDDSGHIVLGSVSADAVEETLSPNCNEPTPKNTHRYALVTATGSHLELTGAASNRPEASLTIDANFDSPSPLLSLHFHRTDQGPPLDWQISVQVPATTQ